MSRLVVEEPDLGLSIGGKSPEFVSTADLSEDETLERWLADVATLAEGIDRRTAAGYLMSTLCWRLGQALGALYLSGAALPPLQAGDLALRLELGGEGKERDLRLTLRLAADGTGRPFDRAAMRQSIVALHDPLVSGLHARTGLSRRALWRLVTDGISAGFLAHGKRTGLVDLAREEITAILSDESSPLHNRQWRFFEVVVEGRPPEWFRLRGGCCRWYRSVGGDLCTLCVLRSQADQVRRLQDLLRSRG